LNSMTGYGSATVASEGREITLELKSVNHRFLDINIRMPRVLMFAEDEIKKEIGRFITRGHVEVNLTYRNTREDSKTVTVDTALAEQYKKAIIELMSLGFDSRVNTMDIAKMPDVLTVTQGEDDNEAVLKLISEAVGKASTALNATRSAEGEKIGNDLRLKLANIKEFANQIEQLSANNLETFADRLQKRLEDLLGDTRIDEQRLHQEIAIYADKIAIDEELVRLDTHIKNMLEYMNSTESVGRKLDFFIQELNREVNTIGSKSVNADIAKLVVTAKSEIEKLREQIQNIE